MGLDHEAIARLAEDYDAKHPSEIIARALQDFGGDCAISFSGAEDVILVDMAAKITKDFRVFSLDTGRLHRETYEYIETLRDHYGVAIEVFMPQPDAVQQLVKEKGLYSFRRDGHKECCGVRKVEPLRRALNPLKAWITGQRKDQSPGTRQAVPVIQPDPTFGSDENPLVKFNPLSNWTSTQVWAYIRENQVPYNPLHNQGYVSIGCEPCTRPVNPGEHERAGRWWWEEETMKECGLHAGNVDD